jgi:hypothetical protein
VTTLSWSAGASRFRVWLDETSGAGYELASICQRRLFPAQRVASRRRLIAVEAFVPFGPIALYGLLGLSFDVVVSNNLVVEVCQCLEPSKPFASIAGGCDQVTVGLPEQFCLPVVEGIEAGVSASGSIPSGRLCVSDAATGAVGSCDLVMNVLARTACKLFITDPMTDEEVRTLVEAVVLGGVRQTG